MEKENLDQLCINTIRMLAVDGVEKAKSGHPGMPMGDAPMAYVLWTQYLKHNPKNPRWPNRDRFVLSAGHGSMLLYSLLFLTEYPISIDDLKQFRQWESPTAGHPEYSPEHGIETTTGPLGQGFGTGVGMAMAQAYLAQYFNRPGFDLVDYHIYAIVSDGDMMEGISSEAASLAGHLGLGKIIYLYSDNKISIEGSTDIAFTEDVGKRFEAYRWHVQHVDGNNLEQVGQAIHAARQETARPSLIISRTHIGFGSPHKQDTADVHGSPLGPEETNLTKKNLGWPLEPAFYVPDEALDHFREALARGKDAEKQWQEIHASYSEKYPELATEWDRLQKGELPPSWEEAVPVFEPKDGPMATRSASGKVLNAVAGKLPMLIGGSADLSPSNNTHLKGFGDFSMESRERNIHFGVREHAMGAILNGMALTGLIPYGGTFLVFSDYMKPSIRLAALMGQRVIYVFTHDSIGLGEDGPTHQPVEHLPALRAIPNITVIRPADANETAWAWRVALSHKQGPVALILTRQNLPVMDRSRYAPAEGLTRGAYVLADAKNGKPGLLILATGSEVSIALEAYEKLTAEGAAVRLVSMPSWELFEKQTAAYKEEVLPSGVRARLAVETASPMGWHKYAGDGGEIIGITRFGASAPAKVIMGKLGFTTDNIMAQARKLLGKG
ncbi:MAG: transketolase [bacterium]